MKCCTAFANTLPFDQDVLRDGFSTRARFNERFLGIALDAAETSTGLMAKTTEEAISNMRDVTVMCEEPADYGKASGTFVYKQAELGMKTIDAYGTLFRKTQAQTADPASEASGSFGATAAANANRATRKASPAAKKAA